MKKVKPKGSLEESCSGMLVIFLYAGVQWYEGPLAPWKAVCFTLSPLIQILITLKNTLQGDI
jgi:hypothetical protein